MKIEEWLGKDNHIGIDIWNKKYCHNGESFDAWVDRVSGGDEEVANLILEKKFLFGGRILANRGLDKEGIRVTYSNCYVLDIKGDSIESIFDTASKTARTFSYGGGVGIDLSNLAPRGAKINNTAGETSGAVSFADLYSMITGLIGQHGRRGALMLSISCRHPDLEEFINAKTDVNRITKANMSVRVDDKFMEATRDGKNVSLDFYRPETKETVIKEVNVREVFTKLCDANYDYGEPGCLFWDTISNWNLLSEYKDFEYAGVNPCAEEPLPAGGSCLLGSINLSEFVVEEERGVRFFDYLSFRSAVKTAVRALNDVLDEGLSLHPLEIQRESVRNWRQIGLGIMGLADMLIKIGLVYGSRESIDLCKFIAKTMIETAVEESALLAKEKGAFDKFDYNSLARSEFYNANITTKSVRALVQQYGMRNSQLLTIAPTGTLSTMLGVSGGIEPIFATHYDRVTKSLDDEEKTYKIYTPIVWKYLSENGLEDDSNLPKQFITAQTLDYKDRIAMQSAWQFSIDASISSTVNIPYDFPKEHVYNIFMLAWKSKCKGITIFRDGCKRDSILTTKSVKKEEDNSITPSVSEEEDEMLIGKKRRLVTGCGNLHVVAFYNKEGKLREVFLNKGSTGGCHNFMNGLSRMISLCAKNNIPLEDIIDQLNSCGACPSYAVRSAMHHDTSKGACCPMAVGNALVEIQKEVDENVGKDINTITKSENAPIKAEKINPCPNCGEELVFSGGCNSCPACGYSKCQ